MILKNEILDLARKSNLAANVIEKDYVLGWILGGISNNKDINKKWVFKGGTCLKKCYFESYRMSEDLDFTVNDPSHLNLDFLTSTFQNISKWVYKESGIVIPEDRVSFEMYSNPRGNMSCEGRLYYNGPIAPSSPRQTPRIKLDLATDEIIVDPPVLRNVSHGYSDRTHEGFHVISYSYIEIFAEKIRALSDRTRPRDLYDVIHFFRRPESKKLASEIKRVLEKKCEFKNLPFPTLLSLETHRIFCENAWFDQLSHQLPVLPSFESFWNELPLFFCWLNEEPLENKFKLSPITNHETQESLNKAICLDRTSASYVVFDHLKFASINRLKVEVLYLDDKRTKKIYTIEPYSLRLSPQDGLNLYAVDVSTQEIIKLGFNRILKSKITNSNFNPRYEIDIMPILVP